MKAAALVLLLAGPAAAQAPFLTDDTLVTSKGGLHVEWTSAWSSLATSDLPAQHQYTSVLDMKWGVLSGVEFGFDIPFIAITGTEVPTARGLGDLDFTLKLRLLDERDGSARPSVAVTAALELPTGEESTGIGSGVTDFGLNLVVSKALGAGWSLTANLGAVLTGNTLTGAEGLKPGRGAIVTGGAALKKRFSESLLAGLVVWGARADADVAAGTELRLQLGAAWSLGPALTLVASVSAGWYESPRATGLVGLTADF